MQGMEHFKVKCVCVYTYIINKLYLQMMAAATRQNRTENACKSVSQPRDTSKSLISAFYYIPDRTRQKQRHTVPHIKQC